MASVALRRRATRLRLLGLSLLWTFTLSRVDAVAGADSEPLFLPSEATTAAPASPPAPAGETPVSKARGESLEFPLAGEPLLTPPAPDDYEVPLDGPIVSLEPEETLSSARKSRTPDGLPLEAGPIGYNPTISRVAWLPGGDDQLGIVSLENLAALGAQAPSGIVAGFGVHFLDGPVRTEMPARLFDFSVGYQRREWIRPNFGWDFAFRVGAFSDFEGSSKEGVRFPSHLVTMTRQSRSLTWLLGIDYLDRDDINLLPVVGAVWTPTNDLRLDLAFPRPRAAMQILDSPSWIYLAGELGGGTWAIEREQSYDDNANYRDLRLNFGIETIHDNGAASALELGYVFARELSYRSALGNYSPRDCLMIALVSRY